MKAYGIVNARLALNGFKFAGADASLALWARKQLDDKSPTFVSSVVTGIAAEHERARSAST